MDFVYSYKVFRELVDQEYDNFGSMAGAMDKSIAARMSSIVFDDNSAKNVKNYCKHWADHARTQLNSDLLRYAWGVMSWDASTALDTESITDTFEDEA